MSIQECASYKLLSFQIKNTSQLAKTRLIVKDGVLYSYITEQTKFNSGAVQISSSTKINAKVYQSNLKNQSAKSVIYQIASDKDGQYLETNLLVYQDFRILFRIAFPDNTSINNKKLKKQKNDPENKILWVNYSVKDTNFGMVWTHVLQPTGGVIRYHLHFITDDETELRFIFDFEFKNPGYVGLVKINKKYIEVDGVANQAQICDFDQTKEYLKYQDFKKNCVSRDIIIDLDPVDEYISNLEYSNNDSILITVQSRQDITRNRRVWSYVDDNLTPDYDFEKYFYLQRPDQMWELKYDLKSADDLIARAYMAKSTSYYLVADIEDLNEVKKEFQDLDSQGPFTLTSDDSDGPAVQITLTFQDTNQFYETYIEDSDVNLEVDQFNYGFEYGHRARQLKGDFIDINIVNTDTYYLGFTPIISTQKYLALMDEGSQVPYKNKNKIVEKKKKNSYEMTDQEEVILTSSNFSVYRIGQKLESLRVTADIRYRKVGSPYIYIIDLTYLNISIQDYAACDKYSILLIKNVNLVNQVSMIQFYPDYTYEIRQFPNRYLTEISSYSAFNSFFDQGLDYFMSPQQTNETNDRISLQFSVNKMYPVAFVKQQVLNTDQQTKLTADVKVGSKVIKFQAVKVDGPEELIVSKIKNIHVMTNKDKYNVNLNDYFVFGGNGFFVDKTIDYIDPDYENRPIKIKDLDSAVSSYITSQFHSFSKGIENDYMIVNYQDADEKQTCKITSYSIFYKEQNILMEQKVSQIDSNDSYFDFVNSEDGELIYIVHMMVGYNKNYRFDLITIETTPTQKTPKEDTNPNLKAYLVNTAYAILEDPLKIHMSNNPSQPGQILIFILDRASKKIIVHSFNIATQVFNVEFTSTNTIYYKDFDVAIINKIAYLFIADNNQVFQILALGLKDFKLLQNLDVSSITTVLPKWDSINAVQCVEYRTVNQSTQNYDCVLQTEDYDLISISGKVITSVDTQGDISAKFENNYIYNFKLPYFFSLGRCMLSQSFINCEIDVPDVPVLSSDPRNQVKNKKIMSVSYPKVKNQQKSKNIFSADQHQFSSRISIIPYAKICSNSNTYFLRTADSAEVKLMFMSRPNSVPNSDDQVVVKKMTLLNDLNLLMDFTDYNQQKLLNATTVNIWMSPRSIKELSLTSDDFDVMMPRDSFLEISFWVCGVIIVIICLLVLTKMWCKGVDEEEEYKNLFLGEDSDSISVKPGGKKNLIGIQSSALTTGSSGWGDIGIIDKDMADEDEYQPGLRYQNVSDRGDEGY